jgi:predicted dehydrogenase
MSSQSQRPKIAVIGGGHLGRIHAKLAFNNPACELIAVSDPSEHARKLVSEQLGVEVIGDYHGLAGRVDGVIIATPTYLHHEVGMWCLHQGIHTLIEKPIASSLPEAKELVQLALKKRLTLQIGHVERFNPVWQFVSEAIDRQGETVRYIEAVREGTYSGRSTDIGIVMDLMIHDIDLVLQAIHSPVASIHAYGWNAIGEHEDFATACVSFKNGAVAHLRASRISPVAKRAMQVYTQGGMFDLDFASGLVSHTCPVADVLNGVRQADLLPMEARSKVKDTLFQDWLSKSDTQTASRNAIESEQNEFFASIASASPVSVSGQHGSQALELASQILDEIVNSRLSRGIIPSAGLFGDSKAA